MGGIAFLEAYLKLPQAQQDATVVVVLTTSMNSRDLGRLDELPIAGLATKPLSRDKIDTLLRLHFQRQLPAVG
jgi:CheY-like chemotaxis protein